MKNSALDHVEKQQIELAGCRAFPAGTWCPVEWCDHNQHERMCRGCRYFTSGRQVSIYQRETGLRYADAR